MKKQFTLLPLLLAALMLSGAGCALSKPAVQIKPMTLNYWRTEDASDSMAEIMAAYSKIHPNVTINYQQMPSADYERKLLEAFAENRGPDIFSVPNVSLAFWKDKIVPLPKETQIPTVTVDEQKRVVTVNQKKKTTTYMELRNSFVEAVVNDVVMLAPPDDSGPSADKIYALTLSLDTLGLYYNRDLLKKANIEAPPATWNDFASQVELLTVREGDDGDLKLSGAAIGTSSNVRHYTDLLAAIMGQNGAILAESNGAAVFDRYNPAIPRADFPPGVQALLFYLSFTEPTAHYYSWNSSMPDSLDAFVTGKAAFYFGFPADGREIAKRAPRLDVGIASLPQIDLSRIFNIAHYPVEVVARKTAHVDEAWDFLQFAAQADQVKTYLAATKRPTALRALINDQKLTPEVAPFVTQVLTAKTWYHGLDYSKVEEAFAYMINTKPTIDDPTYTPIVSQAANLVNRSYY